MYYEAIELANASTNEYSNWRMHHSLSRIAYFTKNEGNVLAVGAATGVAGQ